MIRKVCLSVVCLAAGLVASAQTEVALPNVEPVYEETVEYDANPHKVVTNGFWGNWFVSLGGGAQMYFGDADASAAFGKRITPALDIAVGKWFTPVVGARLMYSGFGAKGATVTGSKYSTGVAIPGTSMDYSKFGVSHLHGDFLLDVRSLFWGYREDRIWDPVVYLGVGWAHTKGNNEPAISAGWMNSFAVTDYLDINLDIRGMLVNDNFDGEMGGRQCEGLLTAAVGVSYKFAERGWEKAKTVYRTDVAQANALLDMLKESKAENDQLKSDLADTKAKLAEAEKRPAVVEIASDDILLFPIGVSKLSREARVNLGGFAAMLKDADPKNVYVITGYADSATGSAKRNEQLSKRRAEAAYNCLVNDYNVNPDQLKVDYKGGVENMFFDDPSFSRAVIISLE